MKSGRKARQVGREGEAKGLQLRTVLGERNKGGKRRHLAWIFEFVFKFIFIFKFVYGLETEFEDADFRPGSRDPSKHPVTQIEHAA